MNPDLSKYSGCSRFQSSFAARRSPLVGKACLTGCNVSGEFSHASVYRFLLSPSMCLSTFLGSKRFARFHRFSAKPWNSQSAFLDNVIFIINARVITMGQLAIMTQEGNQLGKRVRDMVKSI